MIKYQRSPSLVIFGKISIFGKRTIYFAGKIYNLYFSSNCPITEKHSCAHTDIKIDLQTIKQPTTLNTFPIL